MKGFSKHLTKCFVFALTFLCLFSRGEAKIISLEPVSLIILGPPCTKPGEVAVQVSSTLDIPLITPSFLVLNELYDEGEKSDIARALLSQNKPIPPTLLLELFNERLKLPDCGRGYIVNNFFHSLEDTEPVFQFLSSRSKPVLILLKLSDEEIIERKTKTFVCQECGHVYHTIKAPPLIPGICDMCQIPLAQCEEDKEEAVRKMLLSYHELYDPILNYLAQKIPYFEIDLATTPADKVIDNIAHQFEKSLSQQNAFNRFLND